jgi:tetratricopeptide (TPR) repeat protein
MRKKQATMMLALAGLTILGASGFALGLSKIYPLLVSDGPRYQEAERIGRYLGGRVAQNGGDADHAATQLVEALKDDPGNTALPPRLFILHLDRGMHDEAIAMARRMEAAGTATYLSSFALLVEDLAQGRSVAARQRVESLPGDAMAAYLNPLAAAWLDIADGKPEAAMALFAQRSSHPGFAAMQDMQKALIEDWRSATAAADAAYRSLGERGWSPRLLLLYGNFLERTGRIEDASLLYQSHADDLVYGPALEAQARAVGKTVPPRLIVSASQGFAESLYAMAAALRVEGALHLARSYNRLALRLTPDHAEARLLQVDILKASGRPDAAIAECLRLMASGEKAERAAVRGLAWHAGLEAAEMMHQAGNHAQAYKMLEEMAAARTERWDALMRLGSLYREGKRLAEALKAYDRAVQRAGAKALPEHWGLLYARGVARDETGDWTGAHADLRQAMTLSPDNASLLNYLGYSYLVRGIESESGIAMIERAAILRPHDGFIADSLGWARFKQGRYDRAVELLERAADLAPQEAEIYDHLGDAYWMVGRREEARFQWQRALRQADHDTALQTSLSKKLKDGLPATQGQPESASPSQGPIK